MKSKSELAPALCVLLEGDDSIGRDLENARLVQKLHADFPDIEDMRYGGDGPFTAFAETCRTPSLFSCRRIARVNHAESLEGDALAQLAELIDADLPDIYLIMIASEPQAPKKRGAKTTKGMGFAEVRKLVQQKASRLPDRVIYRDFPKPRDYQMSSWLVARTPQLFNRAISPEDADTFLDIVGHDFDVLYSELQKIDLTLPAGRPFDRGAIANMSGGLRDANPFELAQALGRKDLRRALRIIDSLYAFAPAGPVCMSGLF
ncbi:MAG: hypothetical protein PHC61_05210, partial [Chitinivibrionales bacterium]|nr:hypothetical protein [Chitinivibrionales bacterium]